MRKAVRFRASDLLDAPPILQELPSLVADYIMARLEHLSGSAASSNPKGTSTPTRRDRFRDAGTGDLIQLRCRPAAVKGTDKPRSRSWDDGNHWEASMDWSALMRLLASNVLLAWIASNVNVLSESATRGLPQVMFCFAGETSLQGETSDINNFNPRPGVSAVCVFNMCVCMCVWCVCACLAD